MDLKWPVVLYCKFRAYQLHYATCTHSLYVLVREDTNLYLKVILLATALGKSLSFLGPSFLRTPVTSIRQ